MSFQSSASRFAARMSAFQKSRAAKAAKAKKKKDDDDNDQFPGSGVLSRILPNMVAFRASSAPSFGLN